MPAQADPAQKQAWKAPPGTTWPKAQTVELTATGDAQAQTLGATGFPIRLAAPKAGTKAAKAAATPDPVRVEVLDPAQTQRAGLLGLALRVSPGQGLAAKSGKTRLAIDYSGFRYAYGGDYGARLRLVRLDECVPDRHRDRLPAAGAGARRQRHEGGHADRRRGHAGAVRGGGGAFRVGGRPWEHLARPFGPVERRRPVG